MLYDGRWVGSERVGALTAADGQDLLMIRTC